MSIFNAQCAFSCQNKSYFIIVKMKERLWKRVSNSVAKNENNSFVDFEGVSLTEEFCEKILTKPDSKTYATLNKWLLACSNEWLKEFLQCNSLKMIFSTLNFMGMKKANFSDAVIELQIISVIKTVINTTVGIEFLIDDSDLIFSLAYGRLFFILPQLNNSL